MTKIQKKLQGTGLNFQTASHNAADTFHGDFTIGILCHIELNPNNNNNITSFNSTDQANHTVLKNQYIYIHITFL